MTQAVRPNQCDPAKQLWIERLTLTNFRNYQAASVSLGAGPVVLVGANGAGKTNLLEAISLLAPGQGLRRAAFADMARAGGDGSWSIAARLHTAYGALDIGTGLSSSGSDAHNGSTRIVRIDGVSKSGSGVLSDYVEIAWLTPSMDGLFTGPASDRRRFLDRLALCFDSEHGRRAQRFERAMQQRNRMLADGVRDAALFEGVERVMAETALALAAARLHLVRCLDALMQVETSSPFPWSRVMLEGTLESGLQEAPALDVEDRYLDALRSGRERDRAAARTLEGPHRSDLLITHGPKNSPARLCSTGEQKALLLGLVLAHAKLSAERHNGRAPILLLDEVTAHLDRDRRAGLCEEIVRLGAQAFMTGTDQEDFERLGRTAQVLVIEDGAIRTIP
jgi:DNA replication and repair protein RecF